MPQENYSGLLMLLVHIVSTIRFLLGEDDEEWCGTMWKWRFGSLAAAESRCY